MQCLHSCGGLTVLQLHAADQTRGNRHAGRLQEPSVLEHPPLPDLQSSAAVLLKLSVSSEQVEDSEAGCVLQVCSHHTRKSAPGEMTPTCTGISTKADARELHRPTSELLSPRITALVPRSLGHAPAVPLSDEAQRTIMQDAVVSHKAASLSSPGEVPASTPGFDTYLDFSTTDSRSLNPLFVPAYSATEQHGVCVDASEPLALPDSPAPLVTATVVACGRSAQNLAFWWDGHYPSLQPSHRAGGS